MNAKSELNFLKEISKYNSDENLKQKIIDREKEIEAFKKQVFEEVSYICSNMDTKYQAKIEFLRNLVVIYGQVTYINTEMRVCFRYIASTGIHTVYSIEHKYRYNSLYPDLEVQKEVIANLICNVVLSAEMLNIIND